MLIITSEPDQSFALAQQVVRKLSSKGRFASDKNASDYVQVFANIGRDD